MTNIAFTFSQDHPNGQTLSLANQDALSIVPLKKYLLTLTRKINLIIKLSPFADFLLLLTSPVEDSTKSGFGKQCKL